MLDKPQDDDREMTPEEVCDLVEQMEFDMQNAPEDPLQTKQARAFALLVQAAMEAKDAYGAPVEIKIGDKLNWTLS